MFLAIY